MKYEGRIFAREYYPIYSRVLNREGRVIAASKNFAELLYPLNPEKLQRIERNNGYFETVRPSGRRTPFRILSSPLTRDKRSDYIIQVGMKMRSMRKTLRNFTHNLLTAIPIVLVLGAVGGWFLARRSLSPIGYITETARRITASNLAERLKPGESGDELDHLITTLNDMISRLEGSFKKISQFTADASHELKTPISSMKGEAELLLCKPRPQEEYQRVLANHIEKLDLLTRTINDLILLSKFDSNEAGLEMTRIKLDELLVNLWEFLGVLAEQKEVEFTLGRIDEASVLGDRTRLQQLFTNLIDNAVKFTPSGGRIDISLQRDNGFARVSVKDTGIGIPQDELERIFDRFYRVDKSRDRECGGTGLGLSICYWIAEAHHGKIEVESKLEKGSRFTVSLPVLDS
ncbi:MAG: heavy metal sensor histidine kinase [Deltaproteobacteria bacterium]|nr:heavy metal sensor histidine kinase [Deltaproteobacteria bacterium]